MNQLISSSGYSFNKRKKYAAYWHLRNHLVETNDVLRIRFLFLYTLENLYWNKTRFEICTPDCYWVQNSVCNSMCYTTVILPGNSRSRHLPYCKPEQKHHKPAKASYGAIWVPWRFFGLCPVSSPFCSLCLWERSFLAPMACRKAIYRIWNTEAQCVKTVNRSKTAAVS